MNYSVSIFLLISRYLYSNDLLLKPAVKYPDPCEKFRDERTARVDADRLKTTYQAHFSDPGKYD